MSWLSCAQATLEEGAGGALVELALLLSAEDSIVSALSLESGMESFVWGCR